ncbi:hypothetical protein GOODEAATRI_031816 [Goodea atripinnis]|uniref:Uncharacterized protein n=1 Tax=Goodea atripinnis TaxID=208336 RepID=A0ABV0NPY6_9TELE
MFGEEDCPDRSSPDVQQNVKDTGTQAKVALETMEEAQYDFPTDAEEHDEKTNVKNLTATAPSLFTTDWSKMFALDAPPDSNGPEAESHSAYCTPVRLTVSTTFTNTIDVMFTHLRLLMHGQERHCCKAAYHISLWRLLAIVLLLLWTVLK